MEALLRLSSETGSKPRFAQIQLMEGKQPKADLLARFSLLEQSWLTLRKSIVRNMRIFESTKRLSSPNTLSPVLVALPRGQGLNADPKPSQAARAFEDLLEARDESIPALLDEMEECVDTGRNNVRTEWMQAAKKSSTDNLSSRGVDLQQFELPGVPLDRGQAGNALSTVDTVHVFEAKLECYSADAQHLTSTIDKLTWSCNDEDAENQGNLLELQCIVLDAAPALERPRMEALNHYVEIDKEVRRFEASESQRRR